jgi:hypothetical protein
MRPKRALCLALYLLLQMRAPQNSRLVGNLTVNDVVFNVDKVLVGILETAAFTISFSLNFGFIMPSLKVWNFTTVLSVHG